MSTRRECEGVMSKEREREWDRAVSRRVREDKVTTSNTKVGK